MQRKLLVGGMTVLVLGVSVYYGFFAQSLQGTIVFQKSYDFPAATFPNGLCTSCSASQWFDFQNGTTITIQVSGVSGAIIVGFFDTDYQTFYLNAEQPGMFGTTWTIHITNTGGQILRIGNGSSDYPQSHADVTVRRL